jgi:hypothetical protein
MNSRTFHSVARSTEASPKACRRRAFLYLPLDRGCSRRWNHPRNLGKTESNHLAFHLPFSPSRKAIASSSTRTASMTGTTGRASNTKAGSIEQNL